MLDPKDADLSTSSRPLVAAADCHPLLTDAMLVAQDASNPLIQLPSGGYPMPIEPPPRRERGPKGKKRLNLNPSRHGHKKNCEYKGRKPSGNPP